VENYILKGPEQKSFFAAGHAQQTILKRSIKISWMSILKKNSPMYP
jgi:hypothetical protein